MCTLSHQVHPQSIFCWRGAPANVACAEHTQMYCWRKNSGLRVFVSAPECRDIETALYYRTSVRTYVFSELCSIFQYVIKLWLRALQLSGEHKK